MRGLVTLPPKMSPGAFNNQRQRMEDHKRTLISYSFRFVGLVVPPSDWLKRLF